MPLPPLISIDIAFEVAGQVICRALSSHVPKLKRKLFPCSYRRLPRVAIPSERSRLGASYTYSLRLTGPSALIPLCCRPQLQVGACPSPYSRVRSHRSNQPIKSTALTLDRCCYQTAIRVQPVRACQLAVFSGKLPSMEAEIDCKLQCNSSWLTTRAFVIR